MNATTTLRAPAREVTDWFPGDMKPVRDGVYERLNPSNGEIFFSRWMGGLWRIGSFLPSVACTHTVPSSAQDRNHWRGLKEQAC